MFHTLRLSVDRLSKGREHMAEGIDLWRSVMGAGLLLGGCSNKEASNSAVIRWPLKNAWGLNLHYHRHPACMQQVAIGNEDVFFHVFSALHYPAMK